ncbi:hypothetical protein DSL64_14150 [Dyadobacter luteus]|uniref:Lipoprotein n=1 Tax=Dyadobacter luteus TaxID=2259619 RepID=A0A3D8YAB4_9BACT|nr:hypothetical protein [Dyadobacter luteus]REA60676.1 hypothetical protein DSL64_14150 [Dyadobacter luteus]
MTRNSIKVKRNHFIKWCSLFVTGLLLQGCTPSESTLEFEQTLFNQIFYEIVNASYKDKTYTSHCRTSEIITEKGPIIVYDDPECKEKFEALQKDTLHMVLAIADSVHMIYKDDIQFIPKNFKPSSSEKFKIDLSKHQYEKFDFKYLSELKPNDEYRNWEARYPKFIGELSFSKIYFDEKKQKAIMTIEYSCGSKCGLGYFAYLEKVNKKWIVTKVENTWTA